MDHIKVIDVLWFNNITGTTGIVKALDTITNEQKTYIGNCNSCADEETDIQHILNYGTKIKNSHSLIKFLANE